MAMNKNAEKCGTVSHDCKRYCPQANSVSRGQVLVKKLNTPIITRTYEEPSQSHKLQGRRTRTTAWTSPFVPVIELMRTDETVVMNNFVLLCGASAQALAAQRAQLNSDVVSTDVSDGPASTGKPKACCCFMLRCDSSDKDVQYRGPSLPRPPPRPRPSPRPPPSPRRSPR
eukprot:3082751-Pleurochrysis_carterae.AAC.2